MKDVFEVAVNKYADRYGFTPNETWKQEKKIDDMPIAARKISLRKLIDHAIEQTDTFDAFVAYLRADGLTVNVGRQISVQMEEMPKAMRTGQLGENYSIKNIQDRLLTKYDTLHRGHASDFYEAIMPEEMARIAPVKMKKYKDMSKDERTEVIHLLKLKRNPWQESFRDNWQMQRMADDYSFFHAVGHSEALYQAKNYGIYASDLKYVTPDDNKDIVIRVMTTPDMKEDRPSITTTIAVIKEGIIVKEISSKDMSEKRFNQEIYGIQDEYGIKRCSVNRNNKSGNARRI